VNGGSKSGVPRRRLVGAFMVNQADPLFKSRSNQCSDLLQSHTTPQDLFVFKNGYVVAAILDGESDYVSLHGHLHTLDIAVLLLGPCFQLA